MPNGSLNQNTQHQWHQFPNGAYAAVARVHGNDPLHGYTVGNQLANFIEGEATTFGAKFNSANFFNILEAINSNRIQAYFIIAGWEGCQPQIAGAAIQFPTVFTKWNGKDFDHYPAVFGEDAFVLQDISNNFRQRTVGEEYPNGIGLGTYFAQERIRLSVTPRTVPDNGDLPHGMIASGRIAEYSPHASPKMKSIYDRLGAKLDADETDTVLIFNGPNSEIRKNYRIATPVQSLGATTVGRNVRLQQNVFVTSWSGDGGRQQIAVSYTEAISTYTGDPVVRAQVTTNGNIPEGDELRSILASTFATAQGEILRRKWIKRAADVLPSMRIHALQEPQINAALRDLGADTRFLGTNVMHPNAIDFAAIPTNTLWFRYPAAVPFMIINEAEEPNATSVMGPSPFTRRPTPRSAAVAVTSRFIATPDRTADTDGNTLAASSPRPAALLPTGDGS